MSCVDVTSWHEVSLFLSADYPPVGLLPASVRGPALCFYRPVGVRYSDVCRKRELSSYHSVVSDPHNRSRFVYPNVIIMSLCGNLDICLSYYANSYTESCLHAFGRRPWPKVKDAFFKLCISVARLSSLVDFATEIHFGCKKNRSRKCN